MLPLQDVILVSPECVCEVSAQNTPQIIYYSLSNLPLFGCEQKQAVFVCVPLNANELLLPAHFPEEGGALTARASVAQQQQSWRISRSQNEDCQ